jgi:hypothetical protein
MKGIATSSVWTAVAAMSLVVFVTVLQGSWTDRWKDRGVTKELDQAARLLEAVFPKRFGDWELEQELESDPAELDRAGAVGHISRRYRNARTKARVSAFVVCARPHDASGHTPDRCYPGAGFTIGETEHRETVPLDDGRSAETFTGTFRKTGQTIRIFWTYGVRDEKSIAAENVAGSRTWIAPQIARIALAGEPAVYKLYAIVDESRLTTAQAMVECENFLATLIPAFDQAVIDAGGTASDEGPRSAAPVETTAAPAEETTARR